jgi:hypothetical protein
LAQANFGRIKEVLKESKEHQKIREHARNKGKIVLRK